MERYYLKKNWHEGGKTLFLGLLYMCLAFRTTMLPLETNGTEICVGGIFRNLTSKSSTCFSDWEQIWLNGLWNLFKKSIV